MRFAAFAGTSAALAAGVVLRAFHQRPNFYSASVYLAQSQACRMILLNLLLLCVYSFVRALQKLLYGPLRPIEREQLWDRSWYAITETALAMTTFRDEVGAFFLIMFVSLLAGKVWGWISEGRVEILEQQPPANPRLFHARLIASLVVSELFDIIMLRYCINSLLAQPRPGMMVMFAFEFAVLLITSTSTAARYGLSLNESLIVKRQTKARLEERREEIRTARQEAERLASEDSSAVPDDLPREEDIEENDIDVPGWQEKGRWTLFLDLLTDFLKLVVYMMFFTMLILFHGIPIHIIRDVYLTARSFIKRISDFQKYRNATRDMNARYPDATVEELERDGTCIICREDMRPWQQQPDPAPAAAAAAAAAAGARPPNRTPVDERQRPKKLPCGHILHLGCLKSWLERQQVCPTCRTSVLARNPTTNNAPNHNQNPNPHPHLPQHLQPGGPEQRGLPGPDDLFNRGMQRPANANPNPNPQGQGGQQIRARTFNLGPWRFTFAAGNANQVRDAMARVRDPEVQGPQANAEDTGEFGVSEVIRRWQAQRPRSIVGLNALRQALLSLEALVIHEINTLQVTQAQLVQVRAIQAELLRLRELQAQLNGANNGQQGPNAAVNGAAIVGQPQMQPQPVPGAFGGANAFPAQVPPATAVRQAQTEQQIFTAAPEQTELGPGHPDLPAGITLPEGWSLLPLNRTGGDAASDTMPAHAEVIGGVEVTPQIAVPAATATSSDQTSSVAEQNNSSLSAQAALQSQTGTQDVPTISRAPDSSTADASRQSGEEANTTPLSNGLNLPAAPDEASSSIPNWSQGSSSQPVPSLAAMQEEGVNGTLASEEDETGTTANGHAAAGKSNSRSATVEDVDDVD